MFVFMVEYITRKRGIMNTFKKEIKNKDNSVDIVFAKSSDNYIVIINDNYKLIRFNNSKSTFKNSILGTDIGIHSKGFTSVVAISIIIAVGLMAIMLINFRI